VQNDYPQLIVENFSIEQDAALNEWLSEKYDVPEEQRLSSPMIFVGRDVLIGEDTTLNRLIVTVAKYAPTGAERTWDDFDPQGQTRAEQTLIERYKSLGALTVLGAGLINGLNPCAFVTIVFFLSYLAFMGRQGRELLIVGVTFTLGVFIAYLLAGLGLSQLMEPLANLQVTLKRLMFSLTATLCLALSGISVYDYLKARQGKIDEMKIKLSLDLRRQVHKVIRSGAQMRAFYLVAFGLGAVVSLIQLTCTSPIYVGILFLVHEVPEMQANAFLYLLIYNLAYILPLVAIFLLAYFGTSSEQLGAFITRRTASIKILTAVIFLVMAGWLIYHLLPLFGVT
jgi:cytochrome c biogenesis protein CcdA